MNNARLYALQNEWHLIRYESDCLDYWLEEHFPTVKMYLDTPDKMGLCPVYPTTYDMQVIIKTWQDEFGVINTPIKRPTKGKSGISYIPVGNNEKRDRLQESLTILEKQIDTLWADIDAGRVEHYEDHMYSLDIQKRNLKEKIYALSITKW